MEPELYEPKIGDSVVATWKTKTGRTRRVIGTVQAVTAKRVQLRYEHVSSGGGSFDWSVREPWVQRDSVKPSSNKPETYVPIVNALLGAEVARMQDVEGSK